MKGSTKRRGDSWRARYRDDSGREHQRTFPTKRDADIWLRDQLQSVTQGTWVDPSAGNVTFATYAETWLDQQHVRAGTARLQRRRVHLYLAPLGPLPLKAIRRSHVADVVVRCTNELDLSPLVVRQAIGQLRQILDCAVGDRLIVTNPARDRTIALPRHERPHHRDTLDAAQVATIAAQIEPRYRAMVVLGAASGLRSGELRAVTADRISPPIHLAGDVTPRQVTIRVDRQSATAGAFGPVKSASSVRTVTVGATVVAALIDHVRAFGLGPEGLLFTTPGGEMMSAMAAARAWRRASVGLGLAPRSGWHALRHHHASALLSAGINIAAVSKRLGHASPAITLNHYSHALPNDEERIAAISETIAEGIA